MGGNRKHGFRRGNGGSPPLQSWFCDGYQKYHPGNRSRNGTLDHKDLCDRQYYKMIREIGEAAYLAKGKNYYATHTNRNQA